MTLAILLDLSMVGWKNLVLVILTLRPVAPNLMDCRQTLHALSKVLSILLIFVHVLNLIAVLITSQSYIEILTIDLPGKSPAQLSKLRRLNFDFYAFI